MKKTIIVLAVLVAPLFFLNSCRKGEEDPAISLRSRDARLTGNWVLANFSGTATEIDDYDMQIYFTYSYSNGILTETIISSSFGDDRWSYIYNATMTINKNGTMNMSVTDRSSGLTEYIETNDSWYWLDSGKNKSKVHLGAFRGQMGMGEMDVVRLTNRELILRSRFSLNYASPVWDGRMDEDLTYTFVKQ
ncbi:MAG: hypothetical protein ACK4ND_02290 [Cytophagaceae bacterium]